MRARIGTRFTTTMLLGVLALTAGCSTYLDEELPYTRPGPVGRALAVDSALNAVYVALDSSDFSVSSSDDHGILVVVDGSKGEVMSRVSLEIWVSRDFGLTPHPLAVDEEKHIVYVAHEEPTDNPTITIMDGAKHSILARRKVPGAYTRISLDPSDGRLLGIDRQTSVDIVEAGTARLIRRINVTDAVDVGLKPGTRDLVIARASSIDGSIVRYDASGKAFGRAIPLPSPPVGAMFDSATGRLFVLTQGAPSLHAVDLGRGRISWSAFVEDVEARRIVVNSRANRVYLMGKRALSVVSAADGSTITTIPFKTDVVDIALDERTNRVYALDRVGALWVVDGTTNRVLRSIDAASSGESTRPSPRRSG